MKSLALLLIRPIAYLIEWFLRLRGGDDVNQPDRQPDARTFEELVDVMLALGGPVLVANQPRVRTYLRQAISGWPEGAIDLGKNEVLQQVIGKIEVPDPASDPVQVMAILAVALAEVLYEWWAEDKPGRQAALLAMKESSL